MVETENIAALFFELSSSSRLDIILRLEKEPTKLSQIAKELDMSIQEASRHLARLGDAKLVDRCQEGQYSLTPYGRYMIKLINIAGFLHKNADFFVKHDLSVIPDQFQYGLGHIEVHERSEHVMQAFKYTEDLIREADEFIWIHSDQVLSSSLPLIEAAIGRGVDFRVILPDSILEQEQNSGTYPDIPQEYQNDVHQRFYDRVELVIVMSEKRALMAFPDLDGKIDYLGFSFIDARSLEWCRNLFLHFWERAK